MSERRELPRERKSIVKKFEIRGGDGEIHKGHFIVGLYDDGAPGEIFIHMSKEGSTLGGLLRTVAALTSYALQSGISLDYLVRKFSHVSFEPSGFTGCKEVPHAKSVVDYLFRWLGIRFLNAKTEAPIQGSVS